VNDDPRIELPKIGVGIRSTSLRRCLASRHSYERTRT
jgi:hypothetical protein